jgi:2-C-methyl-D-erythritol 4-phosphate cytidylyltransferase
VNAVCAVIVAAGEGSRFGERKQFAYLKGKPVLEWTLEAFDGHPGVDAVVLVLPDEQDRKHYQMRYHKVFDIVRGGERRQDSVWQGFRLIDPTRSGVVLVHDGARPLVSAGLITRVIEAARDHGAVIPVLPSEDTLKEVRDGLVAGTLDRSSVVRAQTPQGFRFEVLKQALEAARKDRFYGTDEAFLVERLGLPVHTIPGDPLNIKITVPDDIKIAEALLRV